MLLSSATSTSSLGEGEVRRVLDEGLQPSDLAGERVLAIIPDSTRTAPIPLLCRLLHETLVGKTERLDFLVALGTHAPMDDDALGKLVGMPVHDERAGRSRIFNHRWDRPETFVTMGVISEPEVRDLSHGQLSVEVPVRLNRLVGDPIGDSKYDLILVCGPVFPHEVAGFSGGNKYFVPGVAGPEIINLTHWMGALLTSQEIIGVADTPVRRMIDRAASFVPTPRLCLPFVMHGQTLHGFYAGSMKQAWLAATEQSAELDICYLDSPLQRVLSIMPEMYDDLWTAAKGMYKLEPAIADGGEVVIYAPHIDEVSHVHGRVIDEIGYHVRDYFLQQWDRFQRFPWGVLAHSTHLRGAGTYRDGVEHPRIQVTLATGIPRERCERIGLGYLDPSTVDVESWAGRESEGVLLVRRAGEMLYRVKGES